MQSFSKTMLCSSKTSAIGCKLVWIRSAVRLSQFGSFLCLGQLPPNRTVSVCTDSLSLGLATSHTDMFFQDGGWIKSLPRIILSSIIPVDEDSPALYLDHPRADVRARYPKILNAFAFEPQIVTQLPKDESGSDTEASGFLEA